MSGGARRLTARAASVALAVGLASQPGCGVAQRAGRGAAEGTIAGLAGKAPDRAGLLDLAGDVKQRAAGGLVEKLSRPDQLEDLARIAGALATGTISGAAQAALGAPETGSAPGRRSAGPSPVEAITEEAAHAFSRQILADLGRAGDGPLSASLAATTQQMTGSVTRGARGELAPLFPECRGADPASCLDLAVERVSRAGTTGAAAGIRDALGVWPMVLGFAMAFGLGALLSLVAAWAFARHRESRAGRLGFHRGVGGRALPGRSAPRHGHALPSRRGSAASS